MALNLTTLDDPNILLAINNAAVPDISMLDLVRAQWLVDHSIHLGLAQLDEKPAGVVVVLSDQSSYPSDYYRWFTERYENFLYIDRVIVADWARGHGVARQLYQEIDHIACEKNRAIVSDVYSEPPNIPSLSLHRAMGYQEVGTQHFPSIQKTATKFMKYAGNIRQKT